MKQIKFILLSILVLLVLFSANADENDICKKPFDLDEFVEAIGDKEKQESYFVYLKKCLPVNTKLQYQVDDTVVKMLDMISSKTVPKEIWDRYLNFTLGVLKINALAGNPSSQHNYAMIHNAKPGSVMAKVIEQDYKKFVHWTIQSASKGEPRALFNIAMRMAQDPPVTGFKQDFEKAYIVFLIIEKINNDNKGILNFMMPHIKDYKSKISSNFDQEKINSLQQQSKKFDLSSLKDINTIPSPTN